MKNIHIDYISVVSIKDVKEKLTPVIVLDRCAWVLFPYTRALLKHTLSNESGRPSGGVTHNLVHAVLL